MPFPNLTKPLPNWRGCTAYRSREKLPQPNRKRGIPTFATRQSTHLEQPYYLNDQQCHTCEFELRQID